MKKPVAKRANQPNRQAEQEPERHYVAHSWEAPIPPPSILAEFNNVVPNGAERIVRAWELESEHRRHIERKEQRWFYIDALAGKSAALVFVLAALSAAVIAAVYGAEWVGALLGGGTITAVALAFLKSRKRQ